MTSAPRSNVGKIFYLLRKIRIRPIHILIPVSLALLAAVFEGVGIGLLIPILNGFLNKSFAFVADLPAIGPLFRSLPPAVRANDKMLFAILLGGFIVIYILKNFVRFLAIVSMAYFSERAVHHHRKTLFAKYLTFGKLFFDTTNIGHHITVLQEHSRNALFPLSNLDKFINSLFALIVYLIVMVMISWKLTLIAIPLFALIHFAVRTLVYKIKHYSYVIVERGSELNKKAIEILSTMPLVKSYRMEESEQRRYTAISDQKAKVDFLVHSMLAVILPLQEIITMLAVAGVFLGALYAFGRDEIASASALIVYFYIVINAANKFGMISGYRGSFAGIVGPLDAVLSVFDEEGKHFVKGGTQTFSGLKEKIAFKNLTFSYVDRDVLSDISFDVRKGQMTAIVGPTGAGKSTLISLFMRYYDCPPGSIFVDGSDVRSFTLDSYLSHIAVVSQETLLLHDSLRNNITYGLPHVSDSELQEVLRRSRLADFVKLLPQGLDTLIGDRGVKLSGGEKQRVSIARALLKKAEILILDEATSSLDSHTEKLIQEAIDEAVADRTSIVIAHRLSTIKHADKIVVLKDGRLTEEGALDQLLEYKGTFFALWEQQKF